MRPATILCVAFMFANGLSFFGADFWYAPTRPTSPNADTGRIYAHPLKGSLTTYLTASEETGLSLLPFAFIVGMGLTAFAYTKEPREPTSPTGQMKEPIPTRKHYIIFWFAIACYIAVVVLIGPFITDLAV